MATPLISPLSPVGRAALALGSAVGAFLNPARADLIATLGETTSGPTLSHLRTRISSTPEGHQMLLTQTPTRFPSTPLYELRSLPKGTLGREYARFMDTRGFTPDERPSVRFVEDPEERWILQRYRDVHDLWHVLTGMPTTVLGELAEKWFEWVQTGLPVAGLSAVVGPLRLKGDQRRVLLRDLVPWAVRSGRNSKDLLGIKFENYLGVGLADLRKEWGIIMADEYLKEPHVLYRRRKRRRA